MVNSMDKRIITQNFIDLSPEELDEIVVYCKDMTVIQLVRYANEYNAKRKKASTTKILAISLGFLGAHRFYLGQSIVGLIYILTLGGGFGILGFIDIFRAEKLTVDVNLRIARGIFDEMLPEILAAQFTNQSKEFGPAETRNPTTPVLPQQNIPLKATEQKNTSPQHATYPVSPSASNEQKNEQHKLTKQNGPTTASSPFELPPDWK